MQCLLDDVCAHWLAIHLLAACSQTAAAQSTMKLNAATAAGAFSLTHEAAFDALEKAAA